MSVAFEHSGRQVSLDDVRQIERYLGVSLPVDYKRFLLAYNVAKPVVPNFFDVGGGEDTGEVRCFYGFSDEEIFDLKATFDIYKGRLPTGHIPVAESVGGNVVCMDVVGGHYGAIYFWDHELSDGECLGRQPTLDDEGVYHLAGSFNEFLEILQEDSNE